MCGRFAQEHPDQIMRSYRARPDDWVRQAGPAYNIAPSQRALVLVADPSDRARVAAGLSWGIPDPRRPSRLLNNARLETAAASPLFGPPLRRRRGAVPVDHFYEWAQEGEGPRATRRPHAVRANDGACLLLAAIVDPEGRFALLTEGSVGHLATIHDRSPVLLHESAVDDWLAPQRDPAAVLRAQGRPPPWYLTLQPLSRRLNRADAEGPECLAPPTEPPMAVTPEPAPAQLRLEDLW